MRPDADMLVTVHAYALASNDTNAPVSRPAAAPTKRS